MLSDDTKRKEYDTWGQTSEQMGRAGGGPSPGRGGFGQQQQSWNFHSTIDPEELFRKIFGDAAFGGGRSPFGADPNFDNDYEESVYGYGAAQEVSGD